MSKEGEKVVNESPTSPSLLAKNSYCVTPSPSTTGEKKKKENLVQKSLELEHMSIHEYEFEHIRELSEENKVYLLPSSDECTRLVSLKEESKTKQEDCKNAKDDDEMLKLAEDADKLQEVITELSELIASKEAKVRTIRNTLSKIRRAVGYNERKKRHVDAAKWRILARKALTIIPDHNKKGK